MFKKLTNEAREVLKGGKGDGKPDSKFDPKELKMGIRDEGEHIKGKAAKKIAKEIAKDHLSQIKNYYSRLKKAHID